MVFIYNLLIRLYYITIFFASLFNKKAQLFLAGRKNIFEDLRKKFSVTDKTAWFHASSLGEFEQGRPVIEEFKKKYPEYKILLTFFSPSGYEIRKNYQGADHICYLPFDFKNNARKFISAVNPEVVFFIKYEFWYNYLKILHAKNIKVYIFSAIFRKEQVFFSWYGGFYRKILTFFNHIFVQNEESVKLLSSIHINRASISGDTRFDRVFQIAQTVRDFPWIEKFKENNFVVIAGSTWEKDEDILIQYINAKTESKPIKFIIAPHEIKSENINRLLTQIKKKTIRYSETEKENPDGEEVLIIDNIGMLSSLYKYSNVAYIGGGFGKGIHNTLEAATFGNPVLFGPNYHRFGEAIDLIKLNGANVIPDYHTLEITIDNYFNNPEQLKISSNAAKEYVEKSRGATALILNFITNEK